MSKASHGSFVWFDLLTTNPKAAIEFYGQVLGWTARPFDNDVPYTLFVGSQGPLGGVSSLPEAERKQGAPPRWGGNVYVDDVDAACALVRKLGGRVLAEPSDFAKVGRLAVIADPQGTTMNLFKPSEPMETHDPTRAQEFTWCELLSSDHESAFAFYSRLFGWKKVRDFDMGRVGNYLIYSHGRDDREMGGMFTRSPEMPPAMWFYYVKVADLDATLVRATAKGGKVMNGPMEVPGGARIAQLADPQGGMFALHEDAKPGAKPA